MMELEVQSDEVSLPMGRSFDGASSGVTLEFRDINFWALTHTGQKKSILQGVSGTCRPGNLLAIMGASGRLIVNAGQSHHCLELLFMHRHA